MSEKQKYIDFEAYEREAEPHKRERVSAWRTAIGLQDVDGLRVSDYLKEIAVYTRSALDKNEKKTRNDIYAAHFHKLFLRFKKQVTCKYNTYKDSTVCACVSAYVSLCAINGYPGTKN